MFKVTFASKIGLKPRLYTTLKHADRAVKRICAPYLKPGETLSYMCNLEGMGWWLTFAGEELACVEIV